MPCSAIALACSGSSRTARRPPWTLGWRVFTRPSIISGKPVRSETSRTSSPVSRSALAVPPVETNSTPRAAKARPRSARPVLSETESKARSILTRSGTPLLPSGRPAEGPGDGRAVAGALAGDDELEARVRRRLAVDPQTVLDREAAAAAAELPDRRAAHPEQRPLAVGGGRDFDRGRQVESKRERHVAAAVAAAGGDQHVLALQLAAVGGEAQLALMHQPEAPDVAVVARLDLHHASGLVAGELDLADALAERAVVVDRGGVAVAERQGRMGGGGAQRPRQIGGKRVDGAAGTAAIDDDPAGAVAHLEGEGRSAA